VSVPSSGLKPKVMAPPKMAVEVAIDHYPNKGGPKEHVEAVKARSDVKRSAIDPVG